jgi:hypothetical protein
MYRQLVYAAATVGLGISTATSGQDLVNPGPLPKVPAPSIYFENSVVCRNQANGTVCQLWLNVDGTYQVAFNRGPQALKPSVDGPWQIEGRDGRYSMRVRKGVTQVCLQPNMGSGSYEVERANEIFASSGCYPLDTHQLGDKWEQKDGADHVYTMWLVEGR